MIPFNVVTPGDFLTGDCLTKALESFAHFYNDVTSKHQKRSKIFVIGGDKHRELVLQQANLLGIENAVQMVKNNQSMFIEEIYHKASLLLLPIKKTIGKIIPEALAFGIPIICFDTPDMREYIDRSCGLMVRNSSRLSCVEDFGQYMHTLYFDPEAQKLLKRGAVAKYEKDFSWNNFEVRRTTQSA